MESSEYKEHNSVEFRNNAKSVQLPAVDPTTLTFEAELYKENQLKDTMILLLRVQDNNTCIECGDTDPQWASSTLGIFLCITCSGCHRNLGVHISRVKSLFLDNWKKDELEFMRDNGNGKSKKYWEVNLPPFFVKPRPTDSVTLKEQYIRAKYERKLYSMEAKPMQSTQQDMPVKEGWLIKQGMVVKNWKKRWLVLVGTLLFYFKKQKDSFPQGVIPLREGGEIDCLTEPIDNKSFCFVIATPSRTFFISSSSALEMYEWVQALRSAKAELCAENPSGKRSSDINIKEIVPRLSSGGIIIQKRKQNKKSYPNCFIGTQMVDWMMKHLSLANRNEAVAIGQKMMDDGFIQSVTPERSFADFAERLYQFLKTE